MIHNDEDWTTRYWSVEDGHFVTRDGTVAKAISGILTRVAVRHDEGRPEANILPCERITVTLTDGDEREVISGRAESNFGQSLARSVANAVCGDKVKIGVTQSDHNVKVHFAWCVKLAPDGSHIKIERPQIAEPGERAQQAIDIIGSHPCNSVGEEVSDLQADEVDPFEEE